MFNHIFDDGTLQKYIAENTHDPWIGTPFEGYAFMNPKQKGEFGERFTTKILQHNGHTVERAHSSTAGYDRIVNGIKVEIKFSLACRKKTAGAFQITLADGQSKKLYKAFGTALIEKIFSAETTPLPDHLAFRAHCEAKLTEQLAQVSKKKKSPAKAKRAGEVKKDQFIINHVSKEKDWQRLLFIGINENEKDVRILWFTKSQFLTYIKSEGKYFNLQQGGKKIKNDDYMCTNIKALMQYDWVQQGLSNWV